MKTELFLLDWLPRTADLDEAEQAAMPEVIRAWVHWAGADLPAEAREELDEAAEDLGGQFPLAHAARGGSGIAELLLADVDENDLDPGRAGGPARAADLHDARHGQPNRRRGLPHARPRG